MDRVGTAKVSPLQSQHDRIAVEFRPADGETETLQRSKRWKFCIKRVIANVTKKWRPRVGNSLMSAKHRKASVLQAPEGISPKAPTRSLCIRLQWCALPIEGSFYAGDFLSERVDFSSSIRGRSVDSTIPMEESD